MVLYIVTVISSLLVLFISISALLASPQDLAQQNYESASNTSKLLIDIQDKFDPVSAQTSSITAIFYSMIGWIVLVTVVLIAVAATTYKHWRRDRSSNFLDNSSLRSHSESRVGSYADFEDDKKKIAGGKAGDGFSPGGGRIEGMGGVDATTPPAAVFNKSVAIAVASIARRPQTGLTSLTSLDETSSVFHKPVRIED